MPLCVLCPSIRSACPLGGVSQAPPRDRAGGVASSGGALCWRVRGAAPDALELMAHGHASSAGPPCAVRLLLPEAVIVGAVACEAGADGTQVTVAVACADGAVYSLSLAQPGDLAGAQAEDVRVSHAPALLEAGATATAVRSAALVDGVLCVGGTGADGAGVMCVPLLGGGKDHEQAGYELRGSTLGKVWEGLRSLAPGKLLSNDAPVVALCARRFAGVARPLLLALHADGALRAWDVAARAVAFACSLDASSVDQDIAADGLAPAGMWIDAPPEASGGISSAVLVVHYADAAGGGAREVSFAVRVTASSGGGGSVAGSVSAMAALRGASAGAAGAPLSVVVQDDTCWMLVELAASGEREVRSVAVVGGGVARRCRLLADDVAALALGSAKDAAMTDDADVDFAERMLRGMPVGDGMDMDGASGGEGEGGASIADVFLEGLLSPVTLCGRALRAALGGASTRAIGPAATRAELREAALGAVSAACRPGEGGGAAAELHAWRALCRRYAHEWSLQRAPCGLAPLGAGAGGIVVMAPTALSLLRPQTFHETLRDLAKEMAGAIAAPRALGRGGGATAVRTVLPRPQGVNAADWQDVQTVCACAAAAEGNLGAFAVAAFGPSLLEGRETPDLACEYARLLLSGQLGGAQLAAGSMASRARAAGRRLGVTISGRLSALRDPARAVIMALNCAEIAVPRSSTAGDDGLIAASSRGAAEAHCVSAAAAQAGDAAFALARSLLVIAAYACLLRGTPGADTSPGATASARAASLPAAQALAARLSLVRWLTTAPAVAPPAGSQAARALTGSDRGRLGGTTVQAPPTLAALLLRVGRGASTIALTSATPAAVADGAMDMLSFLRWGSAPASLASPAPDAAMGAQCVGVAAELYELGQAAELCTFIEAAARVLPPRPGSCLGGGGESAALHFVLGLCHLASAGETDFAGCGAESAEDAAARCFFRASAAIDASEVLRSKDANDAGSADGQDALVLVEPLLAAAAGAPIDACVPALRRLQYYEACLRLFERRGARRAAAAFARAAAGAAPAAAIATSAAGDNEGEAAARTAEERLWTAAFRHACDVRQWTDAYVAAAANPNTERAVECVRRLASVMAEDSSGSATAAEALVNLPFARPGLAEAAAAAVRRRGEATAVESAVPLYTLACRLLTRRGAFRPAASAALRCARRLSDEAPNSMHAERLQLLSSAIAALEQVEEGFQWLDEAYGRDGQEGMHVVCDQGRDGADVDMDTDACIEGAPEKGAATTDGAWEAEARASVTKAPLPTTLLSLRRERAVAAAAAAGGDVAGLTLAASAAALARAGDLESATEAAGLLQPESDRLAALECVAQELARAAVVSQLAGASTGGGGAASRSAERAWRRLRFFLRARRADAAPCAPRLAAAALEAALTLEPRLAPPAWLERECRGDLGALVAVYMHCGRDAAAARAAATALRMYDNEDARRRTRPAAACFPYARIEAALEAVRRDGRSAGSASREGTRARHAAAEELSAALASRRATAAADEAALLGAVDGSVLAMLTGGEDETAGPALVIGVD